MTPRRADALSEPTMSVDDAARLLGFSRAALYEAIKRGDEPVKVVRLGRRIRVVTASVEALLRA